MFRYYYYILISIAFGMLSMQELTDVLFGPRFFHERINSDLTKTFLILLVCIVEAGFIQKIWAKVLGWILTFTLLAGLLFRIMRWPGGMELVGISGILILSNLMLFSILDKNKNLLHYLLFLFIFLRLGPIFMPENWIFCELDKLNGVLILIAGLILLFKLKKEVFPN